MTASRVSFDNCNTNSHGMLERVLPHSAAKASLDVAVVTRSTIRMAARLGKDDELLSRAEITCCKELLRLLCCTSISRRKNFHSDSVSSGSISGCETPLSVP